MYILTGGTGFLGTHVRKKLDENKEDIFVVRHGDYDLRLTDDCRRLFARFKNKPNVIVINMAAYVGGIGLNQAHPYQLFYDNLLINSNVIEQARIANVAKFVQIGTTCSYPKFCPTPFKEKTIWDGYPEETNAPYGIAKRASLAQLQAAWREFKFMGVYVIPTNLYGPYDSFDPSKSHVIPALIKKFYDAIDDKSYTVEIWGSGRATRDFLYVEDAAEGILAAAKSYIDPEQPVNLGSGTQTSIEVLVHYIQEAMQEDFNINWNHSMPDGQPKRQLDIYVAKTELGWRPTISLKEGLKKTVEWYEQFRYG